MNQFSNGTVENRGFPVTFKASAAETATATHASFDTGANGGSVAVTLVATAVTGTSPTLSLVVETSPDGTTWTTVGSLGTNGAVVGSATTASNITTTNTGVTGYFPRGQYVRTRSVVGGTTPSFTYSVTGIVL